MKKRNKKYNPNKPAINPVCKFQLIGEAQEENRMLELWQLTTNQTAQFGKTKKDFGCFGVRAGDGVSTLVRPVTHS